MPDHTPEEREKKKGSRAKKKKGSSGHRTRRPMKGRR